MKITDILKKENNGKQYIANNKIYKVVFENDNTVLLDLNNNEIVLSELILNLDFKEVESSSGWFDDIEEDTKYYYIDSDGEIETTSYSGIYTFNKRHKNKLNMFKTKEKAEEINREQLLYRKIKEFRDKNDKYVDWLNDDRTGWHIYIDLCGKEYMLSTLNYTRDLHTIYFTTGELAEKCLNEVVLPFLKENEISSKN